MKPIPLKNWIRSALALFVLGLAADYYFLHVLFEQKTPAIQESQDTKSLPPENNHESTIPQSQGLPAKNDGEPAKTSQDNFRESLVKCAPEIAAQGLGTPEALLEYLRKSVGVVSEEVSLENYHLTLPDGSARRVQVLVDDNTNSKSKKEIRYFRLDPEGYPERLALKNSDSLQSLLSQGAITQHEVKAQLLLKDGTSLALETHNNKIFEFQFNNLGQVLSCRGSTCHCPVSH